MKSGFQVYRAGEASEREEWERLYNSWPAREPFAHPAFIERFVCPGQQVVAAAWRGADGFILLPLILRPLGAEDWTESAPEQDAISPYGYGGPFKWGTADSEEFWDEFDSWASRNRIVSLLCRLSLSNVNTARFRGEIAKVLDNVVRSLDLDESHLVTDYEHKVRKNIKKAVRSGVTVEVDLRGDRLGEFHRIYLATMSRRGASQSFFFPRSFFCLLQKNCPGEIAYFHAVYGGHVISTELVLVGGESTYSFLGGTEEGGFELRPNDLLKHEIILWSRAQGKKWFVLGGGPTSGDGIFRYKASFAPSGTVPFSVGRRIYNETRYEQLVSMRKAREPDWTPEPSYFPTYRAPSIIGGTA